MMQGRINLVTLGVEDLARSRLFYEALGWRASSASQPSVVFLHGSGVVLALFGRAALAEDAAVEDRPTGFAAVTLAYNAGSEEEADRVYAQAVRAGAQALKTPRPVFWGGYSGTFADPDGHLWEVAHNPGWPIGPDERPQLPR